MSIAAAQTNYKPQHPRPPPPGGLLLIILPAARAYHIASGCSAAWQRGCFGSIRPLVQIQPPGPFMPAERRVFLFPHDRGLSFPPISAYFQRAAFTLLIVMLALFTGFRCGYPCHAPVQVDCFLVHIATLSVFNQNTRHVTHTPLAGRAQFEGIGLAGKII